MQPIAGSSNGGETSKSHSVKDLASATNGERVEQLVEALRKRVKLRDYRYHLLVKSGGSDGDMPVFTRSKNKSTSRDKDFNETTEYRHILVQL